MSTLYAATLDTQGRSPSNNQLIFSAYGHGKLLLSGEYAVLDGALSLAVPTRFGQHFKVYKGSSPEQIQWQSIDHEDNAWLDATLDINDLTVVGEVLPDKERLSQILKACRQLNPEAFTNEDSYCVQTQLEFNRQWGLGSSSTLIHCLASYCNIDQYQLLEATFGGSGYDLACAGAQDAIFYQIVDNQKIAKPASFSDALKDNVYFVYLGQKQNSREGIKHYREKNFDKTALVNRISEISKSISGTDSLSELQSLILEHENLLSETLDLEMVKDRYFADFEGEVKSLGAWGGDFVMMATTLSEEKLENYLLNKGFDTYFRYRSLIL